MFTEVQLRGGLDSVGAAAEVRDVEVVVEDLLLAELLLQLDRVLQFLDLAAEGLPGRVGDAGRAVAGLLDEDVLHVLLGQRRAALGDAAVGAVLEQCAQRALQVDRAVLVEAVVLDVHQRVLHHWGDLGDRHDCAVAGVDGGYHVAVGVVDLRRLRERRHDQVAGEVVEVVGRGLGAQPEPAEGG
ncbi:hypothetical protein ABH931_002659 [Streptacidiphilus sp. MAP12-33]